MFSGLVQTVQLKLKIESCTTNEDDPTPSTYGMNVDMNIS
jgi:hypothetical protein